MRASLHRHFRQFLRSAALCAVAALVSGTADAGDKPTTAKQQPSDQTIVCAFYFAGDHFNTADYRLRDSTANYKMEFAINWEHHTGPAQKRVHAGDLTSIVMADLDFTLKRWPNHRDAIRTLIEYDLAGGKSYGYAPTECWLRHAHEYAPDDVDVILAEAYFHQRKGDREVAKSQYEEALAQGSKSPEVHYNLGLLYFDLADFPHAQEQARIAYADGYPLPGLRNKLKKAGYWTEDDDSVPSRPTASQPPPAQ